MTVDEAHLDLAEVVLRELAGQTFEANDGLALLRSHLGDVLPDEPGEFDPGQLDNTVVLWVNEQGNGQTHSKDEIPFVLAGNYQGKLRTGRWIQYEQRAHNDLFLSLMHLFGSDAVTFGNAAVNGGPLTNLS